MTAPTAAGLGLGVAAIARTVLDAVVSHFQAAQGVMLPVRRIIAPGNPRFIAWDCDQLVVTMSGIGVGQSPGAGQAQRVGNPVSSAGLRHAVFAVQLTRCVPESHDGHRPPPAEDITRAGLALMRDAGLLSQALVQACAAVADMPGSTISGSAIPGAVEVLGPEGGFAAVEGSVAVTAAHLV